ncbi:AAA family ATPase [Rhizobium viscosum]|uniref:ATP-dependent protease Clp ATPase subunit n=1 Tax=Rhizobium viscosum TaxID=1673 RepID=A0ABR9IZR1_RHIVS|nr:AAA family ATPase [Rhizobium viscosum]MBE1508721.1 ATP-dependent protease Clp ATPase subunit [Rhizobium viscosum]
MDHSRGAKGFADTSPDFTRVLIIGNGGSGKTWLARRIAERLRYPVGLTKH